MIHRSHFTRVVPLALMLASLSACTYLIPDDPSVPRYNEVLGERHKPQLNGDGSGPQSSAGDTAPASTASASPVTPVAVSNLPALPPVDAATQARAEKEIAMASPAPAPVLASRQVPVENIAMETNEAPSISSVPPRPPTTGPDTTKARLQADERDLENERTSAGFAKTQLSKDAAAEPSLKSPETIPVIAPSPPVIQTPLPQPQGALTPPPIVTGSLPPAFTPPPPMIAPPPPLPINLTPPPPVTIAQAPIPPIQLTPPPIQLTPPPSMRPQQTAQLTYPAASAPISYPSANGGFDPLATAPSSVTTGSTSSYAGSGFLPDSRYSFRR